MYIYHLSDTQDQFYSSQELNDLHIIYLSIIDEKLKHR